MRKWGVRFLTVNKIRFKHFVLLLLCVCVHNWSVSQWKQYELQIWSRWRFFSFFSPESEKLHEDGFKAMITHKIKSPIPPKHSIILPLTFFLHLSTANQWGDEVKAVFNDRQEKRVDWCPHTQRPKEVRSIRGVPRLNSGCDESGGTVVSTSLGSGCGIGRQPGQFQESENESTCTPE